MGRSGKKKKSSTPTPISTTVSVGPTPTTSQPDVDPTLLLLLRANALKEEGNRLFQSKDYVAALDRYALALTLTPRAHPDRAVFHSNRAACFLHLRPVDHHAVAKECSLALQAQPAFPRALLRRAKALEALGKHDLALLDVKTLLVSDPSHAEALQIARRLQSATSTDLSSRPSPAALGASAVRGAPVAGIGPCLPTRPLPKKPVSPPKTPTTEKVPSLLPNGHEVKHLQQRKKDCDLKPAIKLGVAPPPAVKAESRVKLESRKIGGDQVMRPLKLVYGHDIRLAEMPVKCGFKVLREIVARRFPASKAVLVKYKDDDGDLVTITSSMELRMAEAGIDVKEEGNCESGVKMLRLHVVEVDPEQEPQLVEEEEEVVMEEKPTEDESLSNSSNGESSLDNVENGVVKVGSREVETIGKEKHAGDKKCDHAECKETDIDDWLYEFAQLFRTHIGIDPDAHLDLHELGMELCSEALEETVTKEEAQSLFEMAASKFQEVAALAFFNWGNVYMCAARKRIALDESAPKEALTLQLQSAYDWVRERYALAGQKYEESLRIKPDFYEGLLALGQQHFENAKLQWSFAVASKVDLKTWDPTETIKLFDSAEEKMKAATEMWEKFEEQRANELKDPGSSKKDELLRRKKRTGPNADGQSPLDAQGELSPQEAAEQAAVMRSQIHLFWGNMLFERSQVEYKLGFDGWKRNLDDAVERFKLAGASETDIEAVMKNHSSNEVVNFDEKKVTDLTNVAETTNKDEDKHVLES